MSNMDLYPASEFCNTILLKPWYNYSSYFSSSSSSLQYVNLTNIDGDSLQSICSHIYYCESSAETEGKYSAPMVLIGMYISVASLFCTLAMGLDLLNGFRNKKFWFPVKYFSLNAASITVITVAMKLPVDLSSAMPGGVDQFSKFGGLAFMCTMMSNLMPSLASMDNKSLLSNVTGLSILVITLVVNIFIQIMTGVINPEMHFMAIIYMCMLVLLVIILISSAITIPTSKKLLEIKYRAKSTTLHEIHPQQNTISIVEKLKQLVKRYWVMAETGSPQFVMASNSPSTASDIICTISMIIYIFTAWPPANFVTALTCASVYKWSMIAIVVTQSFGVVVGGIAPIFRCFTVLSFKLSTNQYRKYFLVFKVEEHCTSKLYEWKESGISFSSSSRKSRVFYNLKTCTLYVCIVFQKIIVVSCKTIGLLPIAVMSFIIYCSHHFKSVKAKLFTDPATASSSDDTIEALRNYVLSLEEYNGSLAKRTIKGVSRSMNQLIQKAEKKQPTNLLKLLEESVGFEGVETFDNDQVQSQLYVQHVNSWSLPIVSLTCIAVALPNVHKDKVDNLFKSVGEGLLYTHLVEESLNKAPEYVNIQKATVRLWREVEDNHKWLETTIKRSAYAGKTTIEIVKSFAHKADEIVDEFNTSTNGDQLVEENLPSKLIAANSMYRIAKTIMHTYESTNLEIIDNELFARLSRMIADILAACLSNIPRVVTMRCHESAIEKREASVLAAVHLLGRTANIIERLETYELPNMDPDKMGFIDEWRLHLKQP